MKILWFTRKGEAYVGAPSTRHGFEQAVARITHSRFAGEEWSAHRANEPMGVTVKRLMPDVDWIIDRDNDLHTPKPTNLNVAHIISDLHGKNHYGVRTPEGHIDLLNRTSYKTLFMRYTEIHGTSSPIDVYKSSLKMNSYWLPWSYDLDRFFPRQSRIYDVTFIGRTANPHVYPLRQSIMNEVKNLEPRYTTFHAESPMGTTFERRIDECFAGDEYAKVLGRSNILIFDCSRFRYPLQKFFEGLASGCLVMATKPAKAEALGLINGRTYVEITKENWRSQLHHYLESPGEVSEIAHRGRNIAVKYHTHDVRARQFVRYLKHALN